MKPYLIHIIYPASAFNVLGKFYYKPLAPIDTLAITPSFLVIPAQAGI
jgi:hypothetical protein